jgi:protein TonB
VKLQAVTSSSTPFSAILESQPPWWRLGGGGVLVVVAYLGLLAAALSLGGTREKVVAAPAPPKLVVALVDRPPPVVEAPGARGSAAATEPAVPVASPVHAGVPVRVRVRDPQPNPIVEDRRVAAKTVVVAPATSAASEDSRTRTGTVASTSTSADTTKDVSTGTATSTGTASVVARGSSEVLPFMDGMTRPKLLEMVEPTYTREARDARVAGLFLAKCVITTTGTLQKCRVVKGLPWMDQSVLNALSRWRYSPVIYQGKPVAVDYVIQVRLAGP